MKGKELRGKKSEVAWSRPKIYKEVRLIDRGARLV
jgi:hypothetical protein